jgi:membrane associated rhomboid family serine protease
MKTLWEDLKLQFKMGDVVTKLILWNIGLFVIPEIVFLVLGLSGIRISYFDYVAVYSYPGELLWKPWTLFSYAFFHANIWHLIFNMLMLNFVGRLFLTFFNARQFLGLFFSAAIFAALMYIVGYGLLGKVNTPMVGASAAIMAVLFATAAYSPMMEIYVYFARIKLWHIAAILIAIDLVSLPLNNLGGHLSHLSGAFFGYFYIVQLRAGRDFASGFSRIFDLFTGKKQTRLRKVHKTYHRPAPKPQPKIVTKDKAQQQIDEILDKISKSGYESLSKEEKDFLFRAGKD